MTQRLREGFTTGTAAAAAAKAAALLLAGAEAPRRVDVPLPAGGRLEIPIEFCRPEGSGALARVIKDAGDDPDVTHGAAIEALVEPRHAGGLQLRGGVGVGTVTRPGLPVAVGQPAINPAPRLQIAAAVAEAGLEHAVVTIVVPDGERLAGRTLNPRLGIVGGISILGTRGTVRPYSHDAWRATITQGLAVARAAGLEQAGFSTGGRSERLLMAARPDWPEVAFVQAADHFAFAMAEAGRLGLRRVAWGLFFGKLLKQAQGLGQTHAGVAALDVAPLAGLCRRAGMDAVAVAAIAGANTALQAQGIVLEQPQAPEVLRVLLRQAGEHARAFAGGGLAVDHLLFDFDGRLLAEGHVGN